MSGAGRISRSPSVPEGGVTNWTLAATDSVERYDFDTGVWSVLPALPSPRFGHSATALPDDRMIVVGGNEHPDDFGSGTVKDDAFVFDSAHGTWSLGRTMRSIT